jgi:hypothetical protein
VPYTAALDENTIEPTPASAIAEQHAGALDVLLEGVQRALHRDPGVFEPGEVDDSGDLVLAQDAREETLVEDRAAHERHVRRHELRMPRREVVDDDGRDAGILQGADHVGPDVPGPAGDEPGHASRRAPSEATTGNTTGSR